VETNLADRVVYVPRFADDLQILLAVDQRPESLAHHLVIIDKHNLHGTNS
jgi:hypothetical protein